MMTKYIDLRGKNCGFSNKNKQKTKKDLSLCYFHFEFCKKKNQFPRHVCNNTCQMFFNPIDAATDCCCYSVEREKGAASLYCCKRNVSKSVRTQSPPN